MGVALSPKTKKSIDIAKCFVGETENLFRNFLLCSTLQRTHAKVPSFGAVKFYDVGLKVIQLRVFVPFDLTRLKKKIFFYP